MVSDILIRHPGHPNLIKTHHHPIEYMIMFVLKGHHEDGLNLSYYYDQTFDIALLIDTISQSTLLQYSAFMSSQDYQMYTVPS